MRAILMYNDITPTFLAWFWGICGALFLFSAVYSLLLFRMHKNAVTSQLFWTFISLAFGSLMASFSFQPSLLFLPADDMRLLGRVGYITGAVNSVITVIALAIEYNGQPRPWREEWDDLKAHFKRKDGGDDATPTNRPA